MPMKDLPDQKLNELLKEAYPAVEVSPDFTLRLWRKLMKQPLPWKVPVPALALAAFAGVLLGVWSPAGTRALRDDPFRQLARLERLDLFGNAPSDTVTGSVLRLMKGEKG